MEDYGIQPDDKFSQLRLIGVTAEAPGQGVTIPMGVLHRLRAQARVVMIMVDPASVVPTGDA